MKLYFFIILTIQSICALGAGILLATTPVGKAYYWDTNKEKLKALDQIETKTITSN